jgi:hypothetical protein
MKKIYFSLVAAGLSLTAFGQVKNTAGIKSADSRRVASASAGVSASPMKPAAHAPSAKASYLTETFDGTFPPTGWDTLSGPESTVTDPTQRWHRRANGGAPENTDALNGTTPAPCAGILWVNEVDTHDQYMWTPVVTLAAGGSYRLVFDFATSPHWHAASVAGIDNADITITASTDNGLTWDDIIWQEDSLPLLEASNSQAWLELDPYIWSRAYLNISQYEGEDVIFRWHYLGTDGAPFYLDNVIIEDIPANDLAALKGWSGNIITDFEYYMIPLAQAKPMEVGVVVRNQGANAQAAPSIAVEIKRGATSVYTGTGTESLDPNETDTIWVTTGYTPDQVGAYTITFTVPTDESGDNDVVVVPFEISENIFAHDHPSDAIFRFNQNHNIAMGNLFLVNADATLYGVDIKFETGTAVDLYTRVNVFKLPASGNFQGSEKEFMGGRDDYFVQQSSIGTGNYTSILLTDAIVLEAGSTYLVEIEKVENSGDRLFLGGSNEGDDDFSTVNFGPFGVDSLVERFNNWGFSPAIRMNFDETLSTDEIAANPFGLNVYPNPATNNVNVAFNLNSESAINVSVTDLTGKVVYTNNLGTQTAGTHKVNIDTQALSKGMYMVNFKANNVVSTQKLVIR